MSYQVLARKWRPKTFRAMVGQEHVLRALINALDHKRLHHAYLFTGTRGVGKTTIARILAKCLNCETGVSSEPCDKCGACNEINEGRFVDLIEVDAASRTRVEDTRELLDNVQYAPTRGRYKIYLIDEVHMLSNHSFNALLKTLEEPPEHVKFLLATTDPQKLPVTILSRCLQFNLKNMSAERIVQHLQYVLKEELVPFDEAALWLLARSADGSMRDALSLTDQAIAHGGGKLSDTEVSAMLGTIDHALIENIISGLIEEDGKQVLDAVAEFSQMSPDYDAALAELLTLLHRIAIAQALPEALDNSHGDRERVLKYAMQLAAEDVQLFYQTALIGRRDLSLASNGRSGFEMTLLRMLAFKPQGLVDLPKKPLHRPSQEDASSAVSRDHNAAVSSTEASHKEQGHVEPDSAKTNASTTDNAPNSSENYEGAARQASGESAEPRREEVGLEQEKKHNDISEQAVKTASTNARESEGRNEPMATMAAPSPPSSHGVAAVKQSNEVEKGRGQGAQEPSGKPRETTVLASVQTLAELSGDSWLDLYPSLDIKGILKSTAQNCVLVKVEENRCEFILDDTCASLYDTNHEQRLAQILSEYFKKNVSVKINIGAIGDDLDTPARAYEKKKAARFRAAIVSMKEDPIVKSLQSTFDASLIEETLTIE